MVCHMDDVLVYGAGTEEHDTRLVAVMKRLESAGVTLNSDKCEFSKDKVKFLGHVIDAEGIHADPSKTSAILQMDAPNNVTELRRFLGMVTQLGSSRLESPTYLNPSENCSAASGHGSGATAKSKLSARSRRRFPNPQSSHTTTLVLRPRFQQTRPLRSSHSPTSWREVEARSLCL